MKNSVKLYNFNDEYIGIKISGQGFYDILEIIKSMPVRNYIGSKNVWSIPFGDLAILITKFRKLKIKVEVSDSIKEKYFQFKDWKENQLFIKKNIFNKKLISTIKNQMDIDERLYPFQILGSYFLYSGGDALLCDMVGLGKTVQSLTAVESHRKDKTINFCIIICPSTLKKNWENEINIWTDKTYFSIGGTKSKRKKQYKQAYKYDYMIINYDLLVWDMELIDEFIIQKSYEYALIMDEIQYIKNYSAKRSKMTKNISAFAKYSIGLSATVIENSLLDLWSIFQGINETVFGGKGLFFHFREKYLDLDWFGNPIGYKNEKIIKSRMSPYLIRRMKEQVLDELPDKIENNYWVELSPEQRKFYDNVEKQIVDDISDMEKKEKIKYADILPMIIYLRQCVLSSKLVGHEKNISTKTDQLIKFLESLDENSKIVVFVHFVKMVEILKNELDKKNYKNICVSGDTNSKLFCPVSERIETVNRFNNDDSIKVLVTSDILIEGVNITSANYVVNFDILFNPAKMEQRIGRIDRIGNKHKVINIINIIALNTIEENIFEKVWKKRKMSLDILDDNKFENRLTIKNIKELL